MCSSRFAVAAIVVAAGIAGGCAIDSTPTDEIARSEAAISKAMAAGANRLAPEEMALAQGKVRLGKRWIDAKDYRPARWLAEQAQVDAELAEMKAMSARALQTAARETRLLRVPPAITTRKIQ
ncbi:MAG: DUF4398 domain-containing protein [Usitatibacter sp.]